MSTLMLTRRERKSREHPLLEYSGAGQQAEHWTRKATIRASNLILFKFEHISLPEEPDALLASLKAISPFSVKSTVRLLGEAFNEGLKVTMKAVSRLQELWTQSNSVPMADNNEPVWACVTFRTYFELDNWQIIRHLSCLTCSNRAARHLSTFTTVKDWPDIQDIDTHRRSCLVKAAQEFHDYSDIRSVAVCLSREHLSLRWRPNTTGCHLRWAHLPDWDAHVWPPKLSEVCRNVTRSERLTELPTGKPVPLILSRGFHSAIQDKGVIVAELPNLEPPKRQRFCLFVGHDWRTLGGERLLARIIKHIAQMGSIHRDPNRFYEDMTASERRKLMFWKRILAGDKPPHADWPE